MQDKEIVLRINSEQCNIKVEEMSNGIVTFKNISADSLFDCIKYSLAKSTVESGLLPANCISYVAGHDSWRCVAIVHQEQYADISYFNTVYNHFPLPKLVFKFKLNVGLRVQSCCVGVVEDERLTPHAPMYYFPFSNVSRYSLCVGNNILPKCESLHTLASLPYCILSLPNNDDHFCEKSNKMKLSYRDLLEHLKDKKPSYYYDYV